MTGLQATITDSGYAPVNGLEMYYEIHGAGDPILLLHGGLTTIETSFGHLIPALAKTRRVVVLEQQGHGRTADIDRELTFDNMAADTAACLEYLEISETDVFGYSDGGNVGLGVAVRHPHTVRRLLIAGTNYSVSGLKSEFLEMMASASPDQIPQVLHDAYTRVAPRPEDWPVLVERVKKLGTEFPGWSTDEIRSIAAPTLVMTGDADIVRLEHSVELFQLLQHGHLAVLPMTHHGMRLDQPDRLLPIFNEFFDTTET